MPPATAPSATPNATTSSQALGNLQDFQKSMVDPTTALNGAYSQYGTSQAQQQVQGLRGAINNTTNLLDSVAPSVMGRTGNSLVTAAQATRQISNEQAPIEAQLNKEQTDYSSANADYQNLMGEAQTAANAELTGQQNQESYLQNIYSDLSAQEQQAAAQQAQAQQLAQEQAQFNAQMAESQREFNAQEATAGNESALYNQILASMGGGGSGAAVTPASTGPNLTPQQQKSAAFLRASGATPESIYNYQSPSVSNKNPGIGTRVLGGIQSLLKAPYEAEGKLFASLF